jgi:hypothetical protein
MNQRDCIVFKKKIQAPTLLFLMAAIVVLSACHLNLEVWSKHQKSSYVQNTPSVFESKPTLFVSDVQALEGVGSETGGSNGQIIFKVSLTKAADQVVNFKYSTQDGTASVAGKDYVQTSGFGVIVPGSLSVDIPIDTLPDSFKEGPETFQLVISNLSGAYLQDSVGLGTITDEDQSSAVYLGRVNRIISEATGSKGTPWSPILAAWNKRVKFTFSNKWLGSEVNFPVLVKLNSQRINYADMKSDGSDLVFVDSDGITVLNYEVEVWDTSGDSYIWVQVPRIDANSTSDSFWMYYESSAVAPAVVSANTWDSNFVGVWHLTTLANSTSATITATNNGAQSVSGLAGKSFSLDGGSNFLDLGNPAGVPTALTQRTLCVWAKPAALSSTSTYMVSYGANISTQAFSIGVIDNLVFGDFNSTTKIKGSQEVVKPGVWSHYCFHFDGNLATLYVNGEATSSNSRLDAWNLVRNSFYVGRGINGSGYWNGLIDEMRLSNTIRSPTWLKLEYETTTDSLLFYGPPEVVDSNGLDYFEIKIESPMQNTVTVPYVVTGSTGYETDHNLQSGVATILPGNLSVQIPFVYYRERTLEGNEDMVITLGEPVGANRMANNSGALTFIDEPNSPPVVTDKIVTMGPRDVVLVDLFAGSTDADGDSLVVQSVGNSGLIYRNVLERQLQIVATDRVGTTSLNVIISDGYANVGQTITVMVVSPNTWTGATGDGFWNTPGNWSGLQVPSSNSRVYFEGNACGTNCNATITSNISVFHVQIQDNFPGTITQQGANSITIGSNGAGGLYQSGGIIQGGSGAFSITGSMTLDGGTFISTSGSLNLFGSLVNSDHLLSVRPGGSFIHNGGTVVLVSPNSELNSITSYLRVPYNFVFNNLTVTSGGVSSYANIDGNGMTFKVLGNFVSAGTRVILHRAEVHLEGNFYQTATSSFSMSGSNIIFEGAGVQRYVCSGTCRSMYKFTIDKATGSVEPLDSNPVGVADFELRRGTFKASSSTFKVGGPNWYAGAGSVRAKLFVVYDGTTFDPNGGTLAFEASYANCTYNTEGTSIILPLNQEFVVNHLSFQMHAFSKCNTVNNTYLLPSTFGFHVMGNATLGPAKLVGGVINLEGNLQIASGLEAGSTTALNFVGTNNQTWTHTGGNMINGPITLNKGGGSVTLGSNVTLNTGQTLSLNLGTLNQGPISPGFNLSVPGTLSLQVNTILNQVGASLSYGTLNSFGTINP